MGMSILGGTVRKELSGSVMPAAAELKGNSLMNAIIAKQRFLEQGKTTEAGIFEQTIQKYRAEFFQAGLDPDAIIEEHVRLLTEALQKKT